MIALDTNMLVYAHRPDSPFFTEAVALVAELASSPGSWAIPWPCLHEFLAVVTNPRLYKPPTPLMLALEQAEEWLRAPNLVLLAEEPGYFPHLREQSRIGNTLGGMVHDARIAALCLHHGVTELWTADRDFQRFPALRTRNPLLPAS